MCLNFLYNLFNWIIIQWGIIINYSWYSRKMSIIFVRTQSIGFGKNPQYKTLQKSVQWEPCHSIESDIQTDRQEETNSHFLQLFCKQSSKYVTIKYTSNSPNLMKFNLSCVWTNRDRNKTHIHFGTNPPILINSEAYALVFNCLIVLHIIT
jgi:hypothetical protein